MSLVGKLFPNVAIDAMSEMGDDLKINIFEQAVNNQQKVLLFWYPKDFTFVCPTELHAFQEALPEFQKRNTIVIGASCDTNEVHFAWLNTPKDNGGIEGVTYPILADTHRQLANILGIVVLFIKICFFIFFYMWVRWTIPRFRYDQLMHLGWKILIPLAVINIIVTGIVMVLFNK